jgi:hypothetical protein
MLNVATILNGESRPWVDLDERDRVLVGEPGEGGRQTPWPTPAASTIEVLGTARRLVEVADIQRPADTLLVLVKDHTRFFPGNAQFKVRARPGVSIVAEGRSEGTLATGPEYLVFLEPGSAIEVRGGPHWVRGENENGKIMVTYAPTFSLHAGPRRVRRRTGRKRKEAYTRVKAAILKDPDAFRGDE